jgi:hypothetical protein
MTKGSRDARAPRLSCVCVRAGECETSARPFRSHRHDAVPALFTLPVPSRPKTLPRFFRGFASFLDDTTRHDTQITCIHPPDITSHRITPPGAKPEPDRKDY